MVKKGLIALLFVLLMVPVSSARTIEGIEIPETLTAGDEILLLNGGGARVAFMNKVYVAGMWVQKAMTDPVEIMNADEPMAIRMHVTNDFFASSKNINRAFNNGFRSAMPKGDTSPIQEEVDRFKACFADEIKDGDEFDIIYLPGKGVSVYKNGEHRDTIGDYEFKKSVWSIWMHESRPADKDLKEGMLAGNVSAEALAAKEQWLAKAEAAKEKMMAEAKAAKESAKKAAVAAAAATEAAAKAAKEEATEEAAEMKVAAAEKVDAAQEKAEEVKSETVEAAGEMKQAAAEKAEAVEEAAVAAKEEAAEKARAAKKQAAEKAKAAEKAAKEKAAAVKAEAAAEAKAIAETVDTVLTRDNFGDEDVFFGVNSAALSAEAKRTLAAKSKWMKSNPMATVVVEVTCDSRGSKKYNMMLAEKRAKSVVNFMVNSGVDASRIETEILGAVESAATKKAWANNRRAHFKIK